MALRSRHPLSIEDDYLWLTADVLWEVLGQQPVLLLVYDRLSPFKEVLVLQRCDLQVGPAYPNRETRLPRLRTS